MGGKASCTLPAYTFIRLFIIHRGLNVSAYSSSPPFNQMWKIPVRQGTDMYVSLKRSDELVH